jgi:hypothetical protein
MFWKIDGYLAIPHELLHLLAYRLVGKRCRYRLGEHFVHSLEPRSFRERLFVLLFPLLVIGGAGLVFLSFWTVTYLLNAYPINPRTYFLIAPVWHKSLWLVAVVLLLYAGSCVGDVQLVIRLLLQKLRQQPLNQTISKNTSGIAHRTPITGKPSSSSLGPS